MHSSHNYESSKPSSTKTASASLSSNRPSSETNCIRTPKARAVALERCTVKSSRMRSKSHLSAVSRERARMSWQQPCYCVTCLNLPTPGRGALEMRCKPCSKWRRPNKPKARLLGVKGQPRKNMSSQPETRGRCRSIKDHPLEEEKPCPSKSASSIINGDMTLDMTPMSIAAAGMGMRRSTATAPTAVDDTTATRTEWRQNCRALESSAEQSAARQCQTHFNPRPALLNITTKRSQSCGWQTSDWHASWEVLEETIEPSSANYHSFSLIPLADGSRSSQPTRSIIGPIWSEYLKATLKGPTYDLAIHGTSASASKNQEKLSESTLDASRSSAPSFRTSLTMTSYWPFSQEPPAKTWCGS